MSLTVQYIEELTQTMRNYTNSFKSKRGLSPVIARDIHEVLAIIDKAASTAESPVPNALKLKADLEDRIALMSPTWLANWPAFDFCTVRKLLRDVIEKPCYTKNNLLIDNMTQLTKLANKDNVNDLRNHNLSLQDEIKVLQDQVKKLTQENDTLRSENTQLRDTILALEKSNRELQEKHKILTDKNGQLCQMHIKDLNTIRELSAENENLRNDHNDLRQQSSVTSASSYRR